MAKDHIREETSEHDELNPIEHPHSEDQQKTAESVEKTDESADDWESKYKETYDNYLRLFSEFDNFRKRTTRERAELIKTAGSEILSVILPILDDFDRAIKAMDDSSHSVKTGVELIYHKLKQALLEKGLQEYNPMGEMFDADLHEAITHIPTTEGQTKGTIVEVIEKGYKVHDKIIRYPKVIVAQ